MLTFLYVLVSGQNDIYADMTAVSASFIRDVHPDARILVLCDAPTKRHLYDCQHPLVDLINNLIVGDVPKADAQSRNRLLKSRMRQMIEGDFLYMDSDTLVIKPLDQIFDVEKAIALASNHNRSFPENLPDSEVEYFRNCGWGIPSTGQYMNAGVIFWRSSPEAYKLSRYYMQAVDEIHEKRIVIKDQPAINRAIWQWGGEIEILAERFNAQVQTNPVFGIEASVWHFYESRGPSLKKTYLDKCLEHFRLNGRIEHEFIQDVRSRPVHITAKNKLQEDRMVDDLLKRKRLIRPDLFADTEPIENPSCDRTFCTIVTSDYLPYALNLLQSIRSHDEDVHFNIFISDCSWQEFDEPEIESNTFFRFTEDVARKGIGLRIMEKYREKNHDAYRWSCKPVLINHLILECGYRKVIYVDCDIYFFNPFKFLFDDLETHRVLLTPHWRTPHPHRNPEEYRHLFCHGLFNAGFLAANADATEVMDWWATNCLYSCGKNTFEGEYVDQSILNLMPLYFEGVHVIRHRGCNVAIWNKYECRRVLKANGHVLINDEYPIVFIHFVTNIPRNEDEFLVRYFDKYMDGLRSISMDSWHKEMEKRVAIEKLDMFSTSVDKANERGFIYNVAVLKTRSRNISKLYWNTKRLIIGRYLHIRKWEKSANVAIMTQKNVDNFNLGHWLREVPGTVLSNRPIGMLKNKTHSLTHDGTFCQKDVELMDIPLDDLDIEAIVNSKSCDSLYVSWTEWKHLLGIKRIVLNLPTGCVERPEIAFRFSKHCRVLVLLIHPLTYACHKLVDKMTEYEKSRLLDVELRVQSDVSLQSLLDGHSSELLLWVIRWCMDVEIFMEYAKQGYPIFLIQSEWFEWDTQSAMNSLCRDLSLSLPSDWADRYTQYSIPVIKNGVLVEVPEKGFPWEGMIHQEEYHKIDGILRHFKLSLYDSKAVFVPRLESACKYSN